MQITEHRSEPQTTEKMDDASAPQTETNVLAEHFNSTVTRYHIKPRNKGRNWSISERLASAEACISKAEDDVGNRDPIRDVFSAPIGSVAKPSFSENRRETLTFPQVGSWGCVL